MPLSVQVRFVIFIKSEYVNVFCLSYFHSVDLIWKHGLVLDMYIACSTDRL